METDNELDSTIEKDSKGHMILFVVWSLSEDNTLSLRAICTNKALAKRYRIYVGGMKGLYVSGSKGQLPIICMG